MTKDEIKSLNEVGAKRMGYSISSISKVCRDQCGRMIKDWSPATDMNHAMMVAREIKGKAFDLTYFPDDIYHACFFNPDGEEGIEYFGHADDPALAIMLAVESAEKGGE